MTDNDIDIDRLIAFLGSKLYDLHDCKLRIPVMLSHVQLAVLNLFEYYDKTGFRVIST